MSIVDAGAQEIGGSLEKLLVLLTNPEEYAKRSAELLTQENTVRASIRQLGNLETKAERLRVYNKELDIRNTKLMDREAQLKRDLEEYEKKAQRLRNALS